MWDYLQSFEQMTAIRVRLKVHRMLAAKELTVLAVKLLMALPK